MGNEIKGTTRVCGLLGNPVHHTMSPQIHNTLAGKCGQDLVYVPFEVKEEKLSDAVKGALALDVLGLNVTIPHKSAVIPFLAEIDETAKQIGAVNTLVRTEDGEGFKGYNTDYYGIQRTLENAGSTIKDESVIILGAGGVSRPAAYLCALNGAREVFILNRTLSKAAEIAEAVNSYVGRDVCSPMELKDYGKLPSDRKYLCFQMTSVGLAPDADKAVIEDEEFYKLIHTGFDAVYRPLKTKFLSLCEKNGAKTLDGLHVLLYQGVKAYELWNKTTVSDEMANEVFGKLLSEILQNENIVLTGFMGCGKSAVSATLSRLLGYESLDVDSLIEESQGRRISDIFAENGEEFFRDLETDMLKKLIESGRRSTVLAVGGGLPIREENRRLMKDFGKVICLSATPETVYERIKDDDSRPLLKADNVMERIKQLQNDRKAIYEDAAHIRVDTDNKNLDDIALEIITALS